MPGECSDINCTCRLKISSNSHLWRISGSEYSNLGRGAEQRRAHRAKMRRESRARKAGNG